MKRVWLPICKWKLKLNAYQKQRLWNDLKMLMTLLILSYLAFFVPPWYFMTALTPFNSSGYAVLASQSTAKTMVQLLLGIWFGRFSIIWPIYSTIWVKLKRMPTRLEVIDRV